MDAELTIVITARSTDFLAQLLSSLCRQDYPGTRQAVIRIADVERETLMPNDRPARVFSPHKTAGEIALDFRGRLEVEAIPCRGRSSTVVRNELAQMATTPYLLFLDGDVELADRTLLRRAIEAMKQRSLHLATTSISCRHGGFADDLFCLGHNLMQRAGAMLSPLTTGTFMLFERAAFLRLGGFNERAAFAACLMLANNVPRGRFGLVRGKTLIGDLRQRKQRHDHMLWQYMRTLLQGRSHRIAGRGPLAGEGSPASAGSRPPTGARRAYGR